MTPTEFCYWLQGYMELSKDGIELSEGQCDMIKEHLSLVFTKITKEKDIKEYLENRDKGGIFNIPRDINETRYCNNQIPGLNVNDPAC